MCYSALVNQHSKTLGLTYQARVDLEFFGTLFQNRLEGSGAKISRALELPFLENPESADEKRIAKCIREWHSQEILRSEKELFAQSKRLADAERTLLVKVTKKAQNDQRIATDKISKLKFKLGKLNSTELSESDSRIFPGQYAPLVIDVKGERLVRPFRYLLRPRGQDPGFDRKFEGCYNARRDSLAEVFWWKAVYGRNHGILEIKSFWENVKQHDYEKRKLQRGEEEKNLVLKFTPQGFDQMTVPCIFDRNEEGEFPLDSFALITDEPNPEVAAVGHNRTPIILRPDHLAMWLATSSGELERYEKALTDKQPTYFKHTVAA